MPDLQTLASLVLVPVAVALALVVHRGHRSAYGVGPRHGVLPELVRGVLFSVPFLGALVLVYSLGGLATPSAPRFSTAALGVAAYFAVLFLAEELVFRALLLTGLGVLLGRAAGVLVTSLLVAAAYLFAPGTGVLPVLGAVVTNVLHGLARWRSGRVWWGLGQRWAWNSGVVALGFADSGFSLARPALHQRLTGPAWLTGGGFGVEGGVVGIAFLLAMILLVYVAARGAYGPWTVRPRGQTDAP